MLSTCVSLHFSQFLLLRDALFPNNNLNFVITIDIPCCFGSFLTIFKSGSLIQDLISRLTVNENGIFKDKDLILGVINQRQIEFRKLKMSLLFDGLLNTVHFFTHPAFD